jgi:hypothetical protein
MTSNGDARPPRSGSEEEFVDRLAAAYAPAPMTAGERAAFDASIRARLERPTRWPMLVPALGAAAAAALVWFVFSETSGQISPPVREESTAMVASSWEDELFLSNDLSASEDREASEALPDDYLAIASVFLGG